MPRNTGSPACAGDDSFGFEFQTAKTTVIASQRVARKRAPMTGSAKQSMEQQEWIASSHSLLAMTSRHNLAFSPRDALEVCQEFPSTLQAEGAGNAGCSMHPQPRM